jgi:hypothetical protein
MRLVLDWFVRERGGLGAAFALIPNLNSRASELLENFVELQNACRDALERSQEVETTATQRSLNLTDQQ